MKKEKIESKIKDLNTFRARYKRDFIDIERKYHEKKISNEDFEKKKRKLDLKIEKIKEEIRQFEEQK